MYVFQTHIKPAAGECLPSRSPAGPGSLPCRSAWLPRRPSKPPAPGCCWTPARPAKSERKIIY